jgi:putative selenium metabolism protein SsnA
MLLIGNGCLITRDANNPLIDGGCVAIQANRIVEVGETELLRGKHPSATFVDANGGLIMPGLINSHMHCYSSFARGMDLKAQSPHEFNQILERLWWRLDKVLTLEDVYYSAAVAMIDCIKNGTTTIFDHHASPGCIPGSLFRIADAAKDLGMRTCLCYEVSDRDGELVAQQGIEENAAYIRDCQQAGDSLRRALFGLHASFTLNDELLQQSAVMAKELGVGCHIHTAEALSDVADCRRRYGKRVVERLSDFGVLGPQSIAGHCVHIDEHEMDLLQQKQALVVHNPESNMGNAVGCAPVLAMLQLGVRVGLGTDGYTGDMLESLKVANLLHKHQQQDAAVAWAEPHEMLFGRNAEYASACFGATLGQLVAGALADVIVVDYEPPTPLTAANLNAHILFGCSGRAVRTTVVNGRVLMQDRRLLVADAAEIAAKSRLQAAQLWQRF